MFPSLRATQRARARDASHRDGWYAVACADSPTELERTHEPRAVASSRVARRACARSCTVLSRDARRTCSVVRVTATFSFAALIRLGFEPRPCAYGLNENPIFRAPGGGGLTAYCLGYVVGFRRPNLGTLCRPPGLWRLRVMRWTPVCAHSRTHVRNRNGMGALFTSKSFWTQLVYPLLSQSAAVF